MEAVAATRQPVTVRKVEAAGLRCARCGTVNPYSRFKCQQCGVSLTQYQPQGFRQKALVYAGLGALIVLIVMALLRAL